ncbi:MAG: hypothetical protein AVDCRST_MAG49-3421 [uncultured Thermomicrobiales bacterium]|uniref:Uncharacterized protein n=1 Tax=uncultured Thermomicrobiales bacterium TaxID=1645740 RepID=A0A6J4VAY3_9BACT|nr:MAG: hypothetical protein AVDCRST_MAG49-3421 [uncultured Thermomicrobiales bacterium]
MPVWRALGAVTLDAGLAATGSRVAVAGALVAAGLARPAAQLVCSEAAALAAADAFGYPATLLPLSPGGAPVTLWDRDAAEAVLEHRAVLGTPGDALALLQAGAPDAARRAVVTVVDGTAVAVDGAGADLALADGRVTTLAAAAAIALGATLAAVEVAMLVEGPVVWDVLPVADFRAARAVGEASVGAAIAALVVERLAPPAVPLGIGAAIGETIREALGAEPGATPGRRWLPGRHRERGIAGGVGATA